MHGYFRIISENIQEHQAIFHVELLPSCPVYAGHFPGNPVAPGACNIEMVRQCASIALQREVRIAGIRLCKFMKLLRPGTSETLTLQLSWQDDTLGAAVMSGTDMAIQLKMNIR